MKSKGEERDRLVEQARAHLDATGHPRRAMWGMLGVSGAAGFLASVGLLHLGIGSMALRYPLAVAAAYAAFVGMLRLWLARQASATHRHADDAEGLFASGLAGAGLATLGEKWAGSVPPSAPIATPGPAEEEANRSRWWDAWGGNGLDGIGEGCAPMVLLVLVAALTTLVVSLYLVAVSPLLLAELLVDGAVLGAIARAIPREPTPHWSRAVLRRTGVAALLTALIFGLVGLGFDHLAPGARTFGEAWLITHPPARG